MRISTQALVFSAAEYCAPAWCKSLNASKVNVVKNNTLRTITGCLKPTCVSVSPASICGNCPGQFPTRGCCYPHPRKESPKKQLAPPAQHHHKGSLLLHTTRRLKSFSGPHLRACLQRHGWRQPWKQKWESARPTCIHCYIQDP